MKLVADLVCPKCDTTYWHLYEQQAPDRPPGHYLNVLKPAVDGMPDGYKQCPVCMENLERKDRR
jgi:hypothetical protein